MVYKTMQGREIDLEKLMRQNELTPAVGNMKVNARGDQLGQGGKIIKKREEIVAEYYENNPKAAPKVIAKPTEVEEVKQQNISKNKKTNNSEE